MWRDVRYAFRTLLKSPGFSAIAILTLAVGIGANTAMFSLFRAVFLNPLPIADADRLTTIWERRGTSRDANLPVSGHEYAAWKAESRAFQGLSLVQPNGANLTGAGDPEAVSIARVSSDYFSTLGLNAALGRVFVQDEDTTTVHAAVLSDALWRRRFGGRPSVVGETITIDDQQYTVIGVMPLLPPSIAPDLWVPLDVPDAIRAAGRHNLMVIGRLAPGITIEQAQADLAAVAAHLAEARPGTNEGHSVQVVSFRRNLVGEFRLAMVALAAAVGFVLLIACVNLTNLLLTRGTVRHRELSVRAALGATRGRLVRQLLAESLLISFAGGAAGLLLSAWMIDGAPAVPGVRIPLLETARLDWRGLSAAAALIVVAGIGAGLMPAVRCSGRSSRTLREADRVSDDPGRQRVRAILVVAEVALTLVLLSGAALMINSFVRLRSVDPGFRPERVLVVPVDLPAARYGRAADKRAFQERLLGRIRSIPGVNAVAATSHLPLSGAVNWMNFSVVGRPAARPGQEPTAEFSVVSLGYFETMGIPLLRGRTFETGDARLAVPLIRWFPQQERPDMVDRPQPAPVAIVSDQAARQHWSSADAVGKRIRVLFSPEITIVGVVGDVRQNALDAPAYPHVYLLNTQEPWGSMSMVVRTTGAPLALSVPIRAAVHELDPELPAAPREMEDVLSVSIGRPRFYVLLVGAFGAVALVLALVGIFGVVSYSVAQRTREIGVRMALGAERREIVRLVVVEGLKPVLIGIAIGITGALALTRSIATLLYGVRPTDPVTLGMAVAVLSIVATAACWIPAIRATRVDPTTALRAD